jgi:hypothetical protein
MSESQEPPEHTEIPAALSIMEISVEILPTKQSIVEKYFPSFAIFLKEFLSSCQLFLKKARQKFFIYLEKMWNIVVLISNKLKSITEKRIYSFLLIVIFAVGIFFVGVWFLNREQSPLSEPVKPQVKEVVKERIEKVKEEIPEPNYSEINRLEMEKLPKVEPITNPVQQQKQKEFWPTFFDILTDRVVGEPQIKENEHQKNKIFDEHLPKEKDPHSVDFPEEPDALQNEDCPPIDLPPEVNFSDQQDTGVLPLMDDLPPPMDMSVERTVKRKNPNSFGKKSKSRRL